MKQKNSLPIKLARPAQRALANAGITSLTEITKLTEQELAQLHGIGPNAIEEIKKVLNQHSLVFRKNKK